MYSPHDKSKVASNPAESLRRRVLTRLLAFSAVLLVLAFHVATGNGAQLPSLWLDGSKPVASVLFTQEDLLSRMSQDLGMSSSQVDAVRNIGRTEAQTLSILKQQSDTLVRRSDLDLPEKQAGISSMGYNDRVSAAVQTSRAAVESTLTSEQMSKLPAWVDAQMQEQRSMAVQAALMATAASPVEASAGPYRVYATQYFSNFGADSVDVAVPDKYAKFAALGWENHSGYPGNNYSVTLGLNGRAMAVPVKDCGPWNIDDNYWNLTSGPRPRRLFGDLPTGMPESQAAYYNNYNGGVDQFGRTVSNPAGVDLSPKAGVQLGLGYLVSGWVTISFNWEGPVAPPPPAFPIIGAIKAKYDALGGAPGGPHNAEYDVPGGRAQDFDTGRIIWSRTTGLTSWIYGSIMVKFDSLGGIGGSLGMPSGDEYAVTGGRAFNFAGGQIYWSAGSGAHVVIGGILSKYIDLGGPARMGLPTTDEQAAGAGRVSHFTQGDIYWSPATGMRMICGAIKIRYDSLGGAGTLGLPTSDEMDAPGGRVSNLQIGRIYWSPAGGAHHVMGAIMSKYDSLGGPAGLGLPVTDEQSVGDSRMSEFTLGRIYWNASSGAVTVVGGIFYKYREIGGQDVLGFPTADEFDVSRKPGARVSPFERGQIYWSQPTGAHPVYGGIMQKYMTLGGPGIIGLPTSDEVGIAGGRAHAFEIGRIYWSQSTGAHHVVGAIMGKYDQMGGPVVMGMPVTDESDVAGHTGARSSEFAHGAIYWSPAGGSFGVFGGIADKYKAAGGAATLGLPRSDEMDVTGVSGARMNMFEFGRVYWSAGTGANVVCGGILGTYLLAGGPGSALGLPVSDEFSVPGGRRSNFQHGYIFWDYSTGTTQITTG